MREVDSPAGDADSLAAPLWFLRSQLLLAVDRGWWPMTNRQVLRA
jgi:hypothetical protein